MLPEHEQQLSDAAREMLGSAFAPMLRIDPSKVLPPHIYYVVDGDPALPPVDYTYGLPGCGKTTWAKAEQAADRTIVRVNNDDLGRAMMVGRTKENSALLAVVRAACLNTAIYQGRRVIVDNTNLSPKSRREIIQAAARMNRPVRCVDFTNVNREECIRRDALRTGKEHVGAGVINQMADDYLGKEF